MTSGDIRPLRFNTARSIVCEPGAIRQLGEICAALSAGRVFLVTDPGIIAAGLHEAALSSLSDAGLECSILTTFGQTRRKTSCWTRLAARAPGI